jgi:hypothetical protein
VSSAQADLLHCKHDDLPWWGARARFEKGNPGDSPEAARRLVNKALLADMAVRCGLPGPIRRQSVFANWFRKPGGHRWAERGQGG